MAYDRARKGRIKRDFLRLLQAGVLKSWSDGASKFGVNRQTLVNWGAEDRDWDRAVRAVLEGVTEHEAGEVPDLVTFRKEYLGWETPSHMQSWFDFIDSHRISLILVPPEHAKTQSVGIDYPLWRICRDRSVRIMYVGANQVEAQKRLNAVQRLLTEMDYYEDKGLRNLIQDFGPFTPPRGDKSGRPWTATFFSVAGSKVDQKDYTMQAVGLRGKIYGTRLDLIILDDIVEDFVNENEQQRIYDWIESKAQTRLSEDGKIVIIGTRVAEQDIYGPMLDESDPLGFTANWAKMCMPAVSDDYPNKTLWPEFWPLEKLERLRMPPNMSPRNWSLIYQQEAIGLPGSPFPLDVLEASKNPARRVGQAPEGLPVVIGVDPATEGNCAIVVLAIDRAQRKRYIIDCIAKSNLGQREAIKAEIVYAVRRYGAVRARVEQNFAQLGDDPDLKMKLHNLGCTLEMWKTLAGEKYDDEWGVLGTAGRFAEGLFDIPWGPGSETAMKPFIDELALWRAGRKGKQDRVMALWFADLSAEKLGVFRPGLSRNHRKAPAWVRNSHVPEWVTSGSNR